ncbi:DNA recombination protein RmuC [Spiroplasma chrysopicola]|uniref:DNA recombination protein RmuC n=1 Tax=Spiroplasma chrysopicola DF-1 TaxID=1276227 RepID=R4U3B9_9MOLU|nr:DNA recombination protein RmuC [Spiroplasma chrysopicola]AGM24993.1 DNA recombination protein RmuC [Spiroplasma chrysopicola DF-1]
MTVVAYILLGIILFVLLLFLVLYLIKSKQKNLNNNDSMVLQKDIQASKDLLEQQVRNLQEQLQYQKQELAALIGQSINNDQKFKENLALLAQELGNFKLTADKQDSDLKNVLNTQGQSVAKSLTDVLNNLTVLAKSTNTLEEVEKKVRSLNDIFLNNSKKRGNLGEYSLEKILADMYGENQNIWQRQYKLPNGGLVDAVLKTQGEKEDIAIDAKFSFTNYNKYLEETEKTNQDRYLIAFKNDLKVRVNEVAKYINPENSISSAIMFIPSENVFSFVYAQFPDELISYAFKQKVWITSPTTLSAILFIIEKHSREIAFNKSIEVIRKNLINIKGEFDRWEGRWKGFLKNYKDLNGSIDELEITHKKINKEYEKIFDNNLE